MRRWVPVLVAASGLLVSGGARASTLDTGIEAKVPFEFVVNGTVLPPGNYVVDIASAEDPHVLTIGTRATNAPMIFTTEELSEKHDPGTIELVFDDFGDKLYLAEVWGLEGTGLEVRNTAKEMPKIPADHKHRRVTAQRTSRRAETGVKGK